MTKLQFRVLYREFLFRLVDREVLPVQEGDASRLLGRFAAILVFVSIPFAFIVLAVGETHMPREALLISAWGAEHAVIATTMLAVGLFAVLSWDSAFPSRRDVLVLAPLPVRMTTMFLAKIASLAAALCLTVITFNAGPGLLLPLVLAPSNATPLELLFSVDVYRTFGAYWITMLASAAFIMCCVLAVQGIAAQLPRSLFLRLSTALQMAAFCVFMSVYFLEPSLASPQSLASADNQRLLAWLPSYWFLGLFQQLNGSLIGAAHSSLKGLAIHAWTGLAVAIVAAGASFLLAYFRTLRRIVEEPDIVARSHRLSWLPNFGGPLPTAVVKFGIRTLLRSRQHRVIVSFYVGIGFAIVILFLKTPLVQRLSAPSASEPWHQASVPLLASSFVMIGFWMLGIRIAFTIPLELRANWVFRATQIYRAPDYLRANRRATYVLALAPTLALAAVVFLSLWPLRLAAEHLAVLTLLGITLANLFLHNFRKIPFTCSYLPGKSNLHITFCLCLIFGLDLTYWSAAFERRALLDPARLVWIFAVLCVASLGAWWRTARAISQQTELRFEEELPPMIVGLGLYRDGILVVDASRRQSRLP